MAYTPPKGIWQSFGFQAGDAGMDAGTGQWTMDPNVDYGPSPGSNFGPLFDQQGNLTGWREKGNTWSTGGSGLFGDFGDQKSFMEYAIDPATGQLVQNNGTLTPSKSSATNFMSYAVPAAMAAGLAYYAPAALAAEGAGAASGASAIPGMNAAGGWGVMDASLMAPGAFEAAMGAAPAAAAASPWGTAGEVIGSSGTAGGAASTLPAAATPATAASPWGTAAEFLGPTAGAGAGTTMSSFFPSTLGGWGSAIGNLLPLIGAVGGAAQGSKDQTVTNKTELPPWLQALGPQLTNAAVNAANQPFQPYGGQRIEPFNPTQQAAFGMVQNRAMNGSPVERAGQDAVTRGATGNANPMFGLDNPYLNKQIDNTLGDLNRNFERTVLPNIDAMNTRANTGFGTSSAVNGAGGLRSEAYRNLNETAAKTANDMRYKDYYTQTQLGEGMAGRQLQAAGLAPNLGALDYRNADALLGIGNQQQQLGQQGQDFNYQEFLRQLQYPDQQLQRLGYPFGFQQGSTTTSTQPGVGAVAGGISGLLGGIGMSNMIGRGGTAVSGPATMTPPPRYPNTYGGWPNPYDLNAWGQ